LQPEDEVAQQLPDQENPASHTYDFVDNQPAMAAGAPHPYELVVSERGGAPESTSPFPEEVGFKVTVEDNNSGYEDFTPDPRDEQQRVTPNPFYISGRDRKHSPTPNYENHELIKCEDTTKRDLSQPMAIPAYSVHDTGVEESEHKGLQLESAINFYGRDEIEGDLIDEVDYQNVTVVRTKVANPQMDDEDQQHSDILQQGIATSAIQWGETEDNSCQQKTVEGVDDCYDDVSNLMTSDKALYQNFGPSQSSAVRVASDGIPKDSNVPNAHSEMPFDTTGNYNDGENPGEMELYMNAASLTKGLDQDDDMDYENMLPGR